MGSYLKLHGFVHDEEVVGDGGNAEHEVVEAEVLAKDRELVVEGVHHVGADAQADGFGVGTGEDLAGDFKAHWFASLFLWQSVAHIGSRRCISKG